MVATDLARRDSFFSGSAGVGKSTWARSRLSAAPHMNLLDEGVFRGPSANPSASGDELRRHKRGTWIVVDEVGCRRS